MVAEHPAAYRMICVGDGHVVMASNYAVVPPGRTRRRTGVLVCIRPENVQVVSGGLGGDNMSLHAWRA